MTKRSGSATAPTGGEVPSLDQDRHPAKVPWRLDVHPPPGVSVSEAGLEALTERAAIMEHDGGMLRVDAERAAVANIRPRVALDPNPAPGTINPRWELRTKDVDPRLLPFVDALVELVLGDLKTRPISRR